jgi:acetyl esterase/lipase
MDSEGLDAARWLNERGIAAVVLKYLMPEGRSEIPLNDLHAAILLTRSRAAELNIDSKKVGVMGFSAGGHLASTGAVRFYEATRPDFAVLIYAVIVTDSALSHAGSLNSLLGSPEQIGEAQYTLFRRNIPPAVTFLRRRRRPFSP